MTDPSPLDDSVTVYRDTGEPLLTLDILDTGSILFAWAGPDRAYSDRLREFTPSELWRLGEAIGKVLGK